MIEAGTEVKVKSSCCASSPKCKRCPIVWKRLARVGRATRVSKRRYVVEVSLRKRELERFRRS